MSLEKLVITRLPEPAKSRFAELVQDKEDAYALLSPLIDKQTALRTANAANELELRRLSESRPVILNQAPYAPMKARLETAIEAGRADLQKLQELYEARAYRWQASGGLITAIESYVSGLANDVKISVSKHASDKQPRGDLTKELERCRQRILELKAEISAIAAAPIPSSTAKQLARREIAALADRGRPVVFGLLESREPIQWPTIASHGADLISAIAHGHTVPVAAPGAGSPDVLALYAWQNREALTASIERLIDESADDKHALTDAKRIEGRRAALDAMLKTEREEEAIVRAGRSNGIEMLRRPEADPRAVLGLSDDLPMPDRGL